MARAKRTDRAEARRRYRVETAASTAADEVDETDATEEHDEIGERPAGERGGRPGSSTGRGRVATGGAGGTPTARLSFLSAFRSAYGVADIRADVRALPTLLRGRSFLVPGGLILATLVLAIATARIPNVVSALVVALFLGPLPIGAIYAAGALSSRASYLMGAIASFLGTLGLVIYAVIVAGSVPTLGDVVYAFVFYTVFGGVIGAGLGFYRRLLRALNPTAGQRPPRPRPSTKASAKAR